MSSLFTASQIAIALGQKRQAIQRLLMDSPISGQVMVKGNLANCWTLDALPMSLRKDLAAEVQRRKYRTIEHLLSDPPARWEPSIPLSGVAQHCLDKAAKLQQALAPSIQRKDNVTLSQEEFFKLGAEDYQRVFGHAVSPRYFQELFERTLDRDRGAEEWSRLEIYLDENPAKATAPVPAPASSTLDFVCLRDEIATFKSPSKPTHEEETGLWATIFELFEELVEEGRAFKKTRRNLIRYLWQIAPFLAKSENALRVSFCHKYELWKESGGSLAAILDGRRAKKGHAVKEPLPQKDIDIIAAYAVLHCGGRLRQAARQLSRIGETCGLSQTTLDLLRHKSKRKSYLNPRIDQAIKYDVRMTEPYKRGKQAIDDATASVRRDYSKLSSGQTICADDFTMPVYFYVPDGQGWYIMTRGQILLMVDVRSLRVLAYSIQPDRNYNGFIIRTLQNTVCRKWGIPKKWHFEKGIWLRSKLVKGPSNDWETAHSWDELKVGWETLGVKFTHSIRARSKPAELVGGLLQNLMEGEPGYCGRDERRDCPAVTKQMLDAVNARRMVPSDHFYSFERWDRRFEQVIDQYNQAAQDGEILKGLSPNQAFEANWPHENPPAKLNASCWHLVAHYVQRKTVGRDGISFRFGKRSYRYFDEQTGKDRGKDVLAWFDPECPDLLGVTDLNGKNPYLVERSVEVDYDAEPDCPVYQNEMEKVAGHSSYPKARFHAIKATFEATFRRNLVDKKTAELGYRFQEQRDSLKTEKEKEQTIQDRVRKKAGTLGIPSTILNPRSQEAAEGLDLMAQARQLHARAKGQTPLNQDFEHE